MILNTIHHIAIISSDKDVALHFYHDILGFPIIRSNFRQGRQDWKIDLQINDTTELELFIMANRPARVSNPEAYGLRHLAFQVASVSDTVAELENAGISCEPVRLDAYTGKPMTFFRDPDGLPIEIHFTQAFSSPVYVNAFLKELDENGITYDLQDVNPLELPNIKLPWSE